MAARPTVILVLVATLLASSISRSSAQVGDRGLGIRISGAPAERAEDPRARVAIVDSAIAGATSGSWRVELENDTPEPLTVEVFPTAARVEDGQFRIPATRIENDLTSWISLGHDQLTIPPRERREVEVRIQVEAGAAGGERFAAIVAEPPPVDDGSLAMINRVAARVYFGVEGASPLVSDFEVVEMSAGRDTSGQPHVVLDIRNTGDRTLEVSGDLRLTDGPAGLEAGPFAATDPALLGPEAPGQVRFLLDPQIPAGPWLARADLVSGVIERSAEATITFPDQAGDLSDPVTVTPIERQRRILLPLAVILFLVALLALLFVLFVRRRRKDEDGDHSPFAPPERPRARQPAR